MRAFRNLLKNLLLLVMSCIVVAAIGELLVLLIRGEQAKFPRHVVGSSFGLRINQPNSRYRHKSADGAFWFRINGQGMRADRDFSYAKADGLKRIVSLGDSMTIGYEVDQDQTFSSIIEQRLISKGLSVEVLNAGVSGYGNAEELLYLERELYKYGSDVVLLSFTPNDLEDNVRTNLFRLENGKLVEAETSYVPMAKIADFLNRNPIASFLSERSNLFVLLKERVAGELKLTRGRKDVEVVTDDAGAYQRRLAGAILERLYSYASRRNIPLVIQSIPVFLRFSNELVEAFPFGEFDVHRPGILFLSAKSLLDPYRCKERVFNLRSHFHYSPAAHRIVGEALAKLISERALAKDGMVGLEQPKPLQEIPSNVACVAPR